MRNKRIGVLRMLKTQCSLSTMPVEAYAMAIANAPVNLLLISVFATLSITIQLAVSAKNDNGDFGSYLDVYPPVNLSQNQLDCVPPPASAENGRCPLYIALTMSFGHEYLSSGVIPSVQYALDQINADPDLLPGYSLHYSLTDSQVHVAVS